ncbi:hypothetical protein C7M71_025255 [Peterkaempfera bronchialis]|uniref:Uncharacterized protein n=1 Tax=Peterkaempfera bronchialis TaxID=2126346 RepID=A0A345T2K5_9ACTN|nr:hypothetical protein C7M71_025255 [Peterkaempfera bronchialis]
MGIVDAGTALHLAVALDGAPGGEPPPAVPAPLAVWADRAAEAERGLLDLLTLDDSHAPPPGAGFILGDTAGEAAERSREVALRQVTAAVALTRIGQLWGADLSGRDPDDPPPPPAGPPGSPAAGLYARAAAEGLSIRELAIRSLLRHTFVGTPAEVAARIDGNAQTGAADGYILAGHLNPVGFDEFTDRVVPHLQERGVLRTAYTEGATLRENLGLTARQPSAVR